MGLAFYDPDAAQGAGADRGVRAHEGRSFPWPQDSEVPETDAAGGRSMKLLPILLSLLLSACAETRELLDLGDETIRTSPKWCGGSYYPEGCPYKSKTYA